MKQEFSFDKKEDFIDKLKSLVSSGISKEDITVISSYHVREIDKILPSPPSRIRFFTLAGAIAGLIAGFGLTIYTALSWELITGGKPVVSIPPFIIIAFELTILFGTLASLLGFIIFSGLPDIKKIIEPVEHENRFVIVVESGREGSNDK